MLGKQASGSQSKLSVLLENEEPTVRIAAVEALYRLGQTVGVLPVLIPALQEENLFVRLQALATGSCHQKVKRKKPGTVDHDMTIARALKEMLGGK